MGFVVVFRKRVAAYGQDEKRNVVYRNASHFTLTDDGLLTLHAEGNTGEVVFACHWSDVAYISKQT